MQATVTRHSDELQSAYAGLVTDAAGLLEDMSQLTEALHQQNAAGERQQCHSCLEPPPTSQHLPRLPAAALQKVQALLGGVCIHRAASWAPPASVLLCAAAQLCSGTAAVFAVSEAAAEVRVGQKRRREEGEGAPPATEQLWTQLEDLYSSFAPFRDASIDRWHRKTTLTTGAAAAC